MPTLTETLNLPGGVSPSSVIATVQLWGAGEAITGFEQTGDVAIGGARVVTGNPWMVTSLVGNADIELPAGTVYRCTRTWPGLRRPLVHDVVMPTTGGPYQLGDILAEPPASLASAALTAHAADLTLHGGGQLLGVALKNDADYTTTSTTADFPPGLSITFTVPNRAYEVRTICACSIQEATRWGALGIYDGSGLATGAPAATFKKEAAGFNGSANYETFTKVPNQMHAPAVGTSVTYKVGMQTEIATSDFTLKTQLFGPANCAQIFAVTL